MDSKVSSFFNAFTKFVREDVESNPQCVTAFFNSVLRIDYDQFVNCWEYFLDKHSKLIAAGEPFQKIYCLDVLELSANKNFQKTVKTVSANAALSKAVYFTSSHATDGAALSILIQLMLSQKISEAEEILSLLVKNPNIKTTFGKNMEKIVEKLFFEILKRQGNVSKKVDLSRKLKTLLLTFIAKIKGPEKALLEQRIREIS